MSKLNNKQGELAQRCENLSLRVGKSKTSTNELSALSRYARQKIVEIKDAVKTIDKRYSH